MKSFVAFAVLASVAVAPAMAESFTRDGVTYSYNVKTLGETTLVAGTVTNSGEDFRLRVQGGRVSGRFGNRPVSFRLGDATVASRDVATLLAAK